MLSFGLLVSGELGKICLEHLVSKYKINFIFTDANSSGIISFAKSNNIRTFIGNPRKIETKSFLSKIDTDVILSINYLFIVGRDILDHPNKYAVNFHGSLLPRYRGRTPHIWAIINNDIETGITAHLMTENCDEGDIIDQIRICIGKHTTGAEMLNIYHSLYPEFLSKIITLILGNKVQLHKQNSEFATYFERRRPEDGLIKWDWQKERIYNWVRALANPYPGAFTYYREKKIIINKISYSEIGFNGSDCNGKILKGGNKPVLKTSNGAMVIDEFECNYVINFVEGEIFNEGY